MIKSNADKIGYYIHLKVRKYYEYSIVKNGINTDQNQLQKQKELLFSGTLLSKLTEE